MGGNMNKFTVYSTGLFQVCLLIAGISGCSIQSQHDISTETKNSVEKVGWLHGNCFAIRNAKIEKGTKLLIVRLGNKADVIPAKLLYKTESEKDCYAMMADRKSVNLASGATFYVVSLSQPLETGIGVLDGNGKNPLRDLVVAAKNNAPSLRRFTQCATSEGLQFNLWNGPPYKSKALWSAYYYLGYDTEANCPEATKK